MKSSAGTDAGAVVACGAAKATAPRLAEWPVAYLTYSSPIRKSNLIGCPLPFVAIATIYPLTPGSTSDVRKLAVWLAVKQMKESATEQVVPSTKNKCTDTGNTEEVLV